MQITYQSYWFIRGRENEGSFPCMREFTWIPEGSIVPVSAYLLLAGTQHVKAGRDIIWKRYDEVSFDEDRTARELLQTQAEQARAMQGLLIKPR